MRRFGSICLGLSLGLLFVLHAAGSAVANCADTNLNCLDSRVMKQIQIALKKKKYYSGPIDGRYSKKLRIAFDDLMEDNGQPRPLSPDAIKALWGLDMDYKETDSEERLKFLKAIGIEK
jgi:hypothetical protein